MTEATFDNGVVRLYQGDARRVLRELPAESIHCAVTSPPYWGLRDYGLEPLVWGGDEGHEHAWVAERYYVNGGGSTGVAGGAFSQPGPENAKRIKDGRWREDAFCPCGAWRGSLGLEPTIDLYVQHMVEIFREVRRVLRKDGTLWLNMGDSYAGSQQGIGADGTAYAGPKQATNAGSVGIQAKPRKAHEIGLKPKDLCMMPARVALALQADGWWLRSDIVWSKPNPMPESVTDRPTRSHEYLFLLTKAERYYYDAESIKEIAIYERRLVKASGPTARNAHHDDVNDRRIHEGFTVHDTLVSGRNKRSVWEIPTEPYPEAHFATFPQKLVEPCILAGTSERGVCPNCGAPWERMLERKHYGDLIPKRDMETGITRNNLGGQKVWDSYTPPETTGWRPTCDCGLEETVPATVLDPFIGSGTVAYVAQRLGRRSIGIDLSAEYLALAVKRMRGQTLPMGMG